MNGNHTNQRFAWMDILRFLSALIVFAAHILDKKVQTKTGLFIFDDYFITKYLLSSGGVGVCAFFLISGYIIPSVLEKYKTVKNFLINRFFRIFPLFLLFVATRFVNHTPDPSGIILPFANFWKASFLIGVDWTLRVETMFYIVLAFIFYKMNLSVKNVFLLIASVVTLSLVCYEPTLKRALGYIGYIFLGTIFFIIEKNKEHNIIIYKSDILYILLSCVFILCSWYYFESKDFHKIGFVYTGFVLFITLYLLRNKIKSTKFTQLLGNLTYPLYLSHCLYYGKILGILKFHIFAFFFLLFICYLLHKFVEQPFINYGKRFVK